MYHFGGLADFLDVKATPELLSRAGPVARWREAPLSVYRYGRLSAKSLDVTDIRTGATHRLLHLGSATGTAPEATVLGRVVPIEAAPGLMFARRPLEIDAVTAEAVVGAPDDDALGWLWQLAEAVDSDRLPVGVGRGNGTPLWSDVVPDPPGPEPDPPAPRIQELMDAGSPVPSPKPWRPARRRSSWPASPPMG